MKSEPKRQKGGVVARKRSLTEEQRAELHFTSPEVLRRYLNPAGKIKSRRATGLSRRDQSQLVVAVKRAREMALLPYAVKGRQEQRQGRGSPGA
jgi:small subunit ribosomal protein S18